MILPSKLPPKEVIFQAWLKNMSDMDFSKTGFYYVSVTEPPSGIFDEEAFPTLNTNSVKFELIKKYFPVDYYTDFKVYGTYKGVTEKVYDIQISDYQMEDVKIKQREPRKPEEWL